MHAMDWLKGRDVSPWWWPVDYTQYDCLETSARGRKCILPFAHGRMHEADSGYKWAEVSDRPARLSA